MTGPEHYQAAEMLLDLASEDEIGSDSEVYHLTAAQAHIRLAQVAATVWPSMGCSGQSWRDVAGPGR